MKQVAKINYPKKLSQGKESKVQGIQPPVRKTMYDVILENFKVAQRVTFLHRIIYVGEHTFPPGGEMIKLCFSSSISIVNDSECFERLTGFLIYYNRYFIHLVEGNEDSLMAHIGLLLKSEKYKKYLKNIKLLVQLSHINQRFIIDWNSYSGVPSKLLGEINMNCSLEDSARYVFNCIKKVYATVTMFVDDNYTSATRLTEYQDNVSRNFSMNQSIEEAINPLYSSRVSHLSGRTNSMAAVGGHPYRSYLPEIELLTFIINSNFTEPLSDYYSKYGVVPQRDIYKDKVWPVPSDFVPYDIFTRPYMNVSEMPKPLQKIHRSQTIVKENENNVEAKEEKEEKTDANS